MERPYASCRTGVRNVGKSGLARMRGKNGMTLPPLVGDSTRWERAAVTTEMLVYAGPIRMNDRTGGRDYTIQMRTMAGEWRGYRFTMDTVARTLTLRDDQNLARSRTYALSNFDPKKTTMPTVDTVTVRGTLLYERIGSDRLRMTGVIAGDTLEVKLRLLRDEESILRRGKGWSWFRRAKV
jgi:hypothetical protein